MANRRKQSNHINFGEGNAQINPENFHLGKEAFLALFGVNWLLLRVYLHCFLIATLLTGLT